MTPAAISPVILPDGSTMPRLGLGTWRMGESVDTRRDEIRAVRHAIAAGIPMIDTAEMYGEGGAEEVVGEALRGAQAERDRLFIVSKVCPWHASKRGTIAACEASLKRLGIATLDLYLLHWRGEHPLAETVEAFGQLKRDGKIRRWGVSNFDTDDMRELATVAATNACVANQVYYNLVKRWPEATLLPWQRENGVICMAYSPLDQGSLARHRVVKSVAARLGVTAVQVAVAWLLSRRDVVAIPKSSRIEGIDEIAAGAEFALTQGDCDELERAFPKPPASARMETT